MAENDIIYLEPDDEVTEVINRLKKSGALGVVLVIPRGGAIGSSVINLKLLKRNAEEIGKGIALIANDKVTKNLADQLKIPVFSKASEAVHANISKVEPVSHAVATGIKVNKYQRYDLSSVEKEAAADGQELGVRSRESRAESQEDEDDSLGEDEMEEIEDGDNEVSEDEPITGESNFAEASPDYAIATPDKLDNNEEPEFQKRSIKSEETEKPDDDQNVKKSTFAKATVDAKAKEEEMAYNGGNVRAKHIKAEGTRKFFLIIPIVLILAALAVAYVYLPKAEASIVLKSDTINQNLEINLDKNQKTVDLTTVPAQLLDNEKEETKQFVSTGAKNNGTKATGTITLYNNGQDYKANVLIPAGTIITANGITFTTNKSQFIPPATFTQGPATLDSKGQPIPGAILTTAGTIDADVTATDAGESGNLAPSKFSVGNFDITKVYAQNKAAFSGGTTQNIKFVSSDDINKAEDSIKQDTIKDATGELLDKAKQSNLEIIDKQIQNEVVSINPDKQANDQADNFNITVRIKVFGLAFLDNDLRTAVVNSINSKIDSNKMLINPDQATLTYSVKNVDVDQGTATLSAQFSGSIGQKISADEVKSNIKNKSISAAKSYILGLDGVADVSITPWPSFNKMMPFLSSRVKVNFDYSK